MTTHSLNVSRVQEVLESYWFIEYVAAVKYILRSYTFSVLTPSNKCGSTRASYNVAFSAFVLADVLVRSPQNIIYIFHEETLHKTKIIMNCLYKYDSIPKHLFFYNDITGLFLLAATPCIVGSCVRGKCM